MRTRGQASAGGLTEVLILNLSASGLLLETHAQLSIGHDLMVELPELGMRHATVVWASNNLFGCAFEKPLPEHVVSAALLRSEPKQDSEEPEQGGSASLSFGANLRKLRLAKGLSLTEFAERMHVSRPTIWAWEVGKSRPRSSKLRRLAEILGASPDELVRADPVALFGDTNVTNSEKVSSLASAITETKGRLANIVGTAPQNIKISIEL